MNVGYFAIGAGLAAQPDIIALVAQTVEQAGFHSLWAPEHVVLLDQYASRYPYAADGRIPVPTEADLLDPFVALTYAAAHTKTVRLGTGICLVPERNPVVTAKEVASLDRLSNGRFDFGVGIGWLSEEFAAVGVPWPRRAARTREYLKAMQTLWTQDVAEFDGEFCSFPQVRLNPKPVQRPHPPIIFGGESDAALKRVGEIGDGWFGFTKDGVAEKLGKIKECARAAGRDPDKLSFSVSPGVGYPITMDDVKRLHDLGVQQVIVGGISTDPAAVKGDIEKLAEEFVVPAASL